MMFGIIFLIILLFYYIFSLLLLLLYVLFNLLSGAGLQIDKTMISIAWRFLRAKTPEERAHVDLDTHYTKVRFVLVWYLLYDFIAIDFYTFKSISNMQSLFLPGPLFSSVLSRFSHTKVSLENFLVGVSLMIQKKETRKNDFMRWRQKIITKEESKCALMAFSTKPMKWVVAMQEYLDTLVDEEYRRAILYRVGFCYPYQLLLRIRGASWCLYKS